MPGGAMSTMRQRLGGVVWFMILDPGFRLMPGEDGCIAA
jgi:hypothetical protein